MAGRIIGSVLDVGRDTVENVLYFVGRDRRVTGVAFPAEPITLAKQKAADRGLIAAFLLIVYLAMRE